MGGIAVIGALIAAAVVLDDQGIDHPDEWDERVADLAAFVERERGLEFDHPVTVEFLTEDEYSDRARVDEGMLADEDREAMEESGTVLEALGLVPVDIDMFDTSNEMADTGTLAFYDPVTESVTVRGTEMTTSLEVTLVHELVHVAQDQAFDLTQPPPDESSGAHEAFDALVEGDAVRIELAYVDSLSADEQDAYWDDYSADYDEAEADLGDVPTALQAMFAAPYVLGQPIVDLIAEGGGNDAVDEAFGDPPGSSEHLFDPRSYFGDDTPVDVDEPEIPPGGDEIGEADSLGATTLFVMLSERIDPLVALDGHRRLGWRHVRRLPRGRPHLRARRPRGRHAHRHRRDRPGAPGLGGRRTGRRRLGRRRRGGRGVRVLCRRGRRGVGAAVLGPVARRPRAARDPLAAHGHGGVRRGPRPRRRLRLRRLLRAPGAARHHHRGERVARAIGRADRRHRRGHARLRERLTGRGDMS